jgi:hypothetical protein
MVPTLRDFHQGRGGDGMTMISPEPWSRRATESIPPARQALRIVRQQVGDGRAKTVHLAFPVRLGQVLDTELAIDRLGVLLDGAVGHPEDVGDLLGRFAIAGEVQDLKFLSCQVLESRIHMWLAWRGV